jgi:hypothetical protein
MARRQKFSVKDFNPMGGEASQIAPALWAPSGVDIVPEPFDTASPLRTFGSASGMPSILDTALKGEL